MKLKGKVALVTGGAKRVGREIALALAGRGCHVAITYRESAAQAERTGREIRRRKVKSLAVQVDQRDAAQVRKAVREILKVFGRIDILVNNASSFYPVRWDKVTEQVWTESLETNLGGPWHFSQAVGPQMKRRGAGKIINISDVAVRSPWLEYLPYTVAKGGIVTLTMGLAKALAPQVQVNAIAPGPILPPPGLGAAAKRRAAQATLVKHWGSPKDIAAAVLFFCEGSDFVTGVVLPVDGGRLLA